MIEKYYTREGKDKKWEKEKLPTSIKNDINNNTTKQNNKCRGNVVNIDKRVSFMI